MGKLTIQEVAKILTEKNGLSSREAGHFAAEMFSLILQRLQEGDTVKVKGLGTFKIINVEARESVSVRTGERVVIDSHSKVTFTPDTIMKVTSCQCKANKTVFRSRPGRADQARRHEKARCHRALRG